MTPTITTMPQLLNHLQTIGNEEVVNVELASVGFSARDARNLVLANIRWIGDVVFEGVVPAKWAGVCFLGSVTLRGLDEGDRTGNLLLTDVEIVGDFDVYGRNRARDAVLRFAGIKVGGSLKVQSLRMRELDLSNARITGDVAAIPETLDKLDAHEMVVGGCVTISTKTQPTALNLASAQIGRDLALPSGQVGGPDLRNLEVEGDLVANLSMPASSECVEGLRVGGAADLNLSSKASQVWLRDVEVAGLCRLETSPLHALAVVDCRFGSLDSVDKRKAALLIGGFPQNIDLSESTIVGCVDLREVKNPGEDSSLSVEIELMKTAVSGSVILGKSFDAVVSHSRICLNLSDRGNRKTEFRDCSLGSASILRSSIESDRWDFGDSTWGRFGKSNELDLGSFDASGEARWGWSSVLRPESRKLIDFLRENERTYRQLKRFYEEKRDYVQAGEFHYGEMIMRLRREWALFEFSRWLASVAYWVTSGFAERPGRAFAWLVLVFFGFTAAYFYCGVFECRPAIDQEMSCVPRWGDAFEVSLQALTFQRPTHFIPRGIFTTGLATAERLLGPGIAGFFALAIRRRYRR